MNCWNDFLCELDSSITPNELLIVLIKEINLLISRS